MTDWIGKNIGPYQVTALLSENHRTSVYLAHDTRLEREVAVYLFQP